jgi:hypothetical protein
VVPGLILGVILETVVSAVKMVTVLVAGAPPLNESEGEAKLHEKYTGSVPQLKLIGPVNPPCGVTVIVTLAGLAKGTVTLDGFALAVKPGVTTVSVIAGEVLPVKFASPPYTAVMLKVPALANDVVTVAVPFVNVPVPIVVPPFKKFTVPVGTPPALETVAVKVTFIPMPGEAVEAVSAVVLAAGVARGATTSENGAVAVAGTLSLSAT